MTLQCASLFIKSIFCDAKKEAFHVVSRGCRRQLTFIYVYHRHLFNWNTKGKGKRCSTAVHKEAPFFYHPHGVGMSWNNVPCKVACQTLLIGSKYPTANSYHADILSRQTITIILVIDCLLLADNKLSTPRHPLCTTQTCSLTISNRKRELDDYD